MSDVEKTIPTDLEVQAEMSKNLASILPEMVEELVAKHAETVEAKQKAFDLSATEANKESLKATTKWSSTVKFFNDLKQGNLAELTESSNARAKVMNETTGSAGGFLVPTEFEKTIYEYMDEYSDIRRNASVIQTATNSVKLNELVTKPVVYKTGELVTITASDAVVGEPEISIVKYAGISPFSQELFEDSELNIVDLLARNFAERIAQKEQSDYVNGTSPDGLLQVAGTTNVDLISGTTFSNIAWDDLAAMQVALFAISKAEAVRGKFYMSMNAYNTLRTLKASTSGEYFLPVVPSEQMPARAWGLEIVVLQEYPTTTATETKFVTFTDLRNHLVIADRVGLRVSVDKTGTVGSTNLLTQDAQALKVVKRTGFTTVLENGIVNLLTN